MPWLVLNNEVLVSSMFLGASLAGKLPSTFVLNVAMNVLHLSMNDPSRAYLNFEFHGKR